MTYLDLENNIVTAQQDKALKEYYGEPEGFWRWYSYWCYENGLFNDA